MKHNIKTKIIYEKLNNLVAVSRGLLFLVIILSLGYVFIESLKEPQQSSQKPEYKFTLDPADSDAYAYIPEVDNGIVISDETKEVDFIASALNIDETKDIFPSIMADMVNNGVSVDVSDTAKEVADINEKYYELYEEALPEDIHIEKPLKKKKKKKEEVVLDKEPVVAIVIDDMGISLKRTRDITSLRAPLTASFLTYGTHLDKQVASSVEAGHEVIIHVPMEAMTSKDAAPDVLTVGMNEKDLKDNLVNMLTKFKDAKGINNHMGSRFTEDKEHMAYVMDVLKEKNMFFLDSKTSPKSVGKEIAEKHDVKYAIRNVFLDNENNFNYIMGQLKKTEDVALKNGYAVAIGHPKTETYKALEAWIPSLKEKGIRLVHLSDIVKMTNE